MVVAIILGVIVAVLTSNPLAGLIVGVVWMILVIGMDRDHQ